MGNSKSGRRGNGAGYGGPAKGPGRGSKKQDFGKATNAQGHNQNTPPELTREEMRRRRAQRMEEILENIAEGAERDADRIQAAKALHAIDDGLPIARQVTVTTETVTPEEQRAIRERILGRLSRLAPAEPTG